MAIQTLEAAQHGSGCLHVDWFPEAAGQTFKIGQFVYLVNGKVTVCADDATTIYGLGLKDATGTTDTQIPVIRATDDTLFRMNIYHATPSSATFAVANFHTKYGLEVDSNRCYVDIGQTGADALVIVKNLDAIGDRYCKVLAKVIAAAQQYDAAAA